MTDNPYESPRTDTGGNPGGVEATPSDVRWGSLIVAAIALGILGWDTWGGYILWFLVDVCAVHFMWTGSRVATWICSLRCLLPGLIALPFAIYGMDLLLTHLALAAIAAGVCLLVPPNVRKFFAFQRSRRIGARTR